MLWPSTPHDDLCWDVSSNKSLSHDGGGDSSGLASMVHWAVSNYHANPDKVFLVGSSSGCMMTNVMAATYPDLFAAASCYSGVAAGCFAGSPSSSPWNPTTNQSCPTGQVNYTGQHWSSIVHAMDPSYHGKYPRFQTWHGTSDTVVFYANLNQQLKEWSTVLGVSWSANNTDTPQANYTEMIFGDGKKLRGYSAVGVGHTVPVNEDADLAWFGL
jgi:acetylxylan esterase